MRFTILCLFIIASCCGQSEIQNVTLHNGLTEKIGNFSIELLYHTSRAQQNGNLIMSPITVWTVLAVIAEGAASSTRQQVNHVIRLRAQFINSTRTNVREIFKWLHVKTNTVELAKLNAMFVDSKNLPFPDFTDIAKDHYETELVQLDFDKADQTAEHINTLISNITHGNIPKVVDASNFRDSHMLLASALYFKGQWTMPFNTTSTSKLPFYDSNNIQIGEVNMMYNRHNYPFANIRQLQARVIELPYGKENRLSMIIMLPNPRVTLEDMFLNFQSYTLDKLFQELHVSSEEFSEDEVDCFIPRFKIEADLDVTEILKTMGIVDLFDANKALLPKVARTPLHVSKITHKARIEVTEDGTTASGVTVAEFSNRIGIVRFEANRPFTYIIVEKVTNSIVFGGFYKIPSLY